MRIAHDAGEFGFENPVQHVDDFVLVELCHCCLCVFSDERLSHARFHSVTQTL